MDNKINYNPYLYQNGSKTIEVVLTGRIARRQKGGRETILYEIESADKDLGFKQWVKLDQLFTIETENNK